jgi:hypothetical protein
MTLFNKPSGYTYGEVCHMLPDMSELRPAIWVPSDCMTPQEKEDHPKSEDVGGYLKKMGYKEAWIAWWDNASEEDKRQITNLPNFDSDIFFEITGIRVFRR